MNAEPRQIGDYSDRQVEAAWRVLVDVGQVLSSFRDAMVVVGGWVPDLLLADRVPRHAGSIDVDFALDAAKLSDGRYAELLKLLLDTRRYRMGSKQFQLVTEVLFADDPSAVVVELEFLASSEVRLEKHNPKLFEGFRVLRFESCEAAFQAPIEVKVEGKMISGAVNSTSLRVASLADFLVMKAHAIDGRDKPKDVYDLCYCLDGYPGGIDAAAAAWWERREDKLVSRAVEILRAKFASVDHYGPRQLAAFHGDEESLHARRAYELIQRLLRVWEKV
jgi:hypothetical protein